MSDPKDPIPEDEADAQALAEFEAENTDLDYRGRGRPKLPPDMKRREKLVISLTAAELKSMMHAAADADGGPLRIQDWARSILLGEARKKEGG